MVEIQKADRSAVDGGSLGADQAESLRRMIWASEPTLASAAREGMLITVHAAESGYGATTTAIQIALAFQRRGHDTMLVDGDGCDPPFRLIDAGASHGSLADVAQRRRTLTEVGTRGPCGITVVPAGNPLGTHEDGIDPPAIVTDSVVEQLRRTARRRVVVVDVSRVETCTLLVPVAHHCIFVTRSDPEAATATYRRLKVVTERLSAACCWLVVNHVTELADAKAAVSRLGLTCDRFLNLALDCPAYLPRDPLCDVTSTGHRESFRWETSAAYRHALQPLIQRLETHLVQGFRTTLNEVTS
jgi:MinD-like ATPase involved in chromosome partitioning or flagellar assembly